MTTHTNEPHARPDRLASLRLKLAAAWTSFMFLVIYIDYFHLYQPGEIDSIRGGIISTFPIGPALITGFFVLIAVPSLMVMLSVALPPRAARIANLVVATLFIPICAANAIGAPADWWFYYAVTIGVELVILAFILRWSWMLAREGTR